MSCRQYWTFSPFSFPPSIRPSSPLHSSIPLFSPSICLSPLLFPPLSLSPLFLSPFFLFPFYLLSFYCSLSICSPSFPFLSALLLFPFYLLSFFCSLSICYPSSVPPSLPVLPFCSPTLQEVHMCYSLIYHLEYLFFHQIISTFRTALNLLFYLVLGWVTRLIMGVSENHMVAGFKDICY